MQKKAYSKSDIGPTKNTNKDQFIQFLRGVSITAVVFIHCLGKAGVAPLVIKPWLYFSVMLFVFLSGYLTPKDKVKNVFQFYKKRLIKILIPYAVWTLIYLIIEGNLSPYQFVRAIIRANASGHLYYLHDYAQLVVLTPIIYWMLDRKPLRYFLYSISPLYIIFNYFLKASGNYMLVPICAWLILVYLLGLEHEKWEHKIKNIKFPVAAVFVVFFAVAQSVESFLWRSVGVEALANTQVKFTSLFYSLSVFILIFCISSEWREKLSKSKFFLLMGNLSFGIYCCHEMLLDFYVKYIPKGMPNALILLPLGLFTSAALVFIINKILPKKICSLIGFV